MAAAPSNAQSDCNNARAGGGVACACCNLLANCLGSAIAFGLPEKVAIV